MEKSAKFEKVSAYLRDPTCTTFAEGTPEKWLCMMTRMNNWSFLQCFQNGVRQGIRPQDLYEGLKKVVWDTDKVDQAYRQMMLQGDVKLPEWFYGSCWYDYVDTCIMLNKDFSNTTIMDWWIRNYLVEPQFGIKASSKVQQECRSRFLGYVMNPPRKPLIDRVKDLFNTYKTTDFMPRN